MNMKEIIIQVALKLLINDLHVYSDKKIRTWPLIAIYAKKKKMDFFGNFINTYISDSSMGKN